MRRRSSTRVRTVVRDYLVLTIVVLYFFFQSHGPHGDLHSFPTRRSSDLDAARAIMTTDTAPKEATVTGPGAAWTVGGMRSEEHTSELQSRGHLVCRLLLEKKKKEKKGEEEVKKLEDDDMIDDGTATQSHN